MSKIRVLRVLEYTYPSVERMEADMARWQHGTRVYGSGENAMTVKSVALPLEVLAGSSGVELSLGDPACARCGLLESAHDGHDLRACDAFQAKRREHRT